MSSFFGPPLFWVLHRVEDLIQADQTTLNEDALVGKNSLWSKTLRDEVLLERDADVDADDFDSDFEDDDTTPEIDEPDDSSQCNMEMGEIITKLLDKAAIETEDEEPESEVEEQDQGPEEDTSKPATEESESPEGAENLLDETTIEIEDEEPEQSDIEEQDQGLEEDTSKPATEESESSEGADQDELESDGEEKDEVSEQADDDEMEKQAPVTGKVTADSSSIEQEKAEQVELAEVDETKLDSVPMEESPPAADVPSEVDEPKLDSVPVEESPPAADVPSEPAAEEVPEPTFEDQTSEDVAVEQQVVKKDEDKPLLPEKAERKVMIEVQEADLCIEEGKSEQVDLAEMDEPKLDSVPVEEIPPSTDVPSEPVFEELPTVTVDEESESEEDEESESESDEESESDYFVEKEEKSEYVVEEEEESNKIEPEGTHVYQRSILDPEALAALEKADELKREEKTKTIQVVLAKLISASEDGQDIDPEALAALQKAATKVVYLCLTNADDLRNDVFPDSGETTASLMSHALLEEAEEYYSERGNESSADFSAALQSFMAGNGDESEECQDIDPEALAALKKVATKVLYRCLKNADDLKDDVLHSWDMTASLMRDALLEEAEKF